ncbi:MAG: PaaX family transcriptional regulator C-terminal domain-containing protein, partial [Actinomycetota bacterium]|nr:PaaX family transcriptional regulator C-terminal domain-containing protein [Actinomycetota bacterium]
SYRWLASDDLGRWTGVEAFLLRTMLVHDLRRARLADPHLPVELMGADWPGREAHELAASAYRAVDSATWSWLQSEFGLARPAGEKASGARFTGRP